VTPGSISGIGRDRSQARVHFATLSRFATVITDFVFLKEYKHPVSVQQVLLTDGFSLGMHVSRAAVFSACGPATLFVKRPQLCQKEASHEEQQ